MIQPSQGYESLHSEEDLQPDAPSYPPESPNSAANERSRSLTSLVTEPVTRAAQGLVKSSVPQAIHAPFPSSTDLPLATSVGAFPEPPTSHPGVGDFHANGLGVAAFSGSISHHPEDRSIPVGNKRGSHSTQGSGKSDGSGTPTLAQAGTLAAHPEVEDSPPPREQKAERRERGPLRASAAAHARVYRRQAMNARSAVQSPADDDVEWKTTNRKRLGDHNKVTRWLHNAVSRPFGLETIDD